MLSPVAEPVIQRWNEYTESEHEVWRCLYRRRIGELERQASRVFLEGLAAIGLDRHAIPDLGQVNVRLSARTGWMADPVGGFLPAAAFFESLARRRFPTTVTIRSPENLDYTPEPDIFHDVFGHVPLHADPDFADFLARFGALAAVARDEDTSTRMARLFWYTVEFGLIRERGQLRVYGSGLISSSADAANALSDNVDLRRFDLEQVMSQPFEIDRLQPILFWIEDFGELASALSSLRPGPPRSSG